MPALVAREARRPVGPVAVAARTSWLGDTRPVCVGQCAVPSSGPVAGCIPRGRPPVPVYLWRRNAWLSSPAPLVVVLVVPKPPAHSERQQQGPTRSAVDGSPGFAVVVGRSDEGSASDAVRAADDTGADLPGQRWAVAAVTRPDNPAVEMTHPDWCVPDRCGHLVPPVMTHMARRHRGPLYRFGEARTSGTVVTYLIGRDARTPLIAVHATSRAGNAWAELSLAQTAALVERLRSLLDLAANTDGGDDA